MATAIQFVSDFLRNKADPRVADWLLMSSPWPNIFIVLVYLALVYVVLPAYMKDRKPYTLTTIIKIYNIIQIVTCVWIIYWILISGWIQGDVGIGCYPVDYSNKPRAVALLRAFHWTYFLKMAELVETVFFILRKKYNQVSKLHVYHHASTMTLAWIGTKYVGGGMASFPIVINSFIHVLMYSYYYLSSLGPKWQKQLAPWKPRLTMAQMVQFTFLIIHSLTAFTPGCNVPRSFLLLYLPNVALIYKMFYDFYQKSYTENGKKQKSH